MAQTLTSDPIVAMEERLRVLTRVMTTKAAIAQTPKELVWALNKTKLYRYVPVLPPEKRHPVPLILVFAIMNRPSILDLRPGHSFVEFMIGHGYDVYLLDWGSPGLEDRYLKFDDYSLEYMPRAIRKLKEALHSRVEIISADIDSRFELPDRRYDLVFFLGILYHLKNPYYILDLLSRHARFCFISTRVARFTPDQIEIRRAPVAYLVEPDELNNDPTNYWIFSEAGLRRLLRRTGWEVCNYLAVGDTETSQPNTIEHDERAYCLVRSRRLTDPGLTAGLLKGWHQLEEGHWRWTERCFSAELPVPRDRDRATLELHFVYPDYLRQRIAALRLKASIDDVSLGEVPYSASGEQVYRAAVPSHLLRNSSVVVNFELDRAIAPDAVDLRERGIVVLSVGLHEHF